MDPQRAFQQRMKPLVTFINDLLAPFQDFGKDRGVHHLISNPLLSHYNKTVDV